MVTAVGSSSAQPTIQEGMAQTPLGKIKPGLNRNYVLAIVTRCIIFAAPAFAFALGIHQIKGGWDDGAITAAFARTLAEAGRFALTPLSEKVEGFSSMSWVFLLAIPYYLFHSAAAILGPDEIDVRSVLPACTHRIQAFGGSSSGERGASRYHNHPRGSHCLSIAGNSERHGNEPFHAIGAVSSRCLDR